MLFSAKRWDRRNRADLIESATPLSCRLSGGVLPGIESTPPDCSGCNVWNGIGSKSEDYTTAP